MKRLLLGKIQEKDELRRETIWSRVWCSRVCGRTDSKGKQGLTVSKSISDTAKWVL